MKQNTLVIKIGSPYVSVQRPYTVLEGCWRKFSPEVTNVIIDNGIPKS